MDWAQQQTHCPQGHPLSGSFSYDSCRCANATDGRGHFFLWCDQCRRFYNPPGCDREHDRKGGATL